MNPITEICYAFLLTTIGSEILVFGLYGIYCLVCKILKKERKIELG